jgi:hypothetical protein
MGIVGRNKSFLLTAILILAIGAVIFGGVTVVRVMATGAPATPTAAAVSTTAANNPVDSFGNTGYAPVTVTATQDTPTFVAEHLKQQRGMVLLVYVKGAAADEDMLHSFDSLKSQYAADMSFFSFKAEQVTQTGDLLDQLQVSDPPVLAIIDGSGKVSALYAGWIDRKVMEQRLSDALGGS